MKIRIEMTAAEMMTAQSVCNLFDDEPVKRSYKIMEEFSEHTTERTSYNKDGSYTYDLEVSEAFTICVTNWARDIIAQTKGLIMSAVDTYRNLTKMMGLKKLIIDGEEVNVCKKVTTKVTVDNMYMRVVTHPLQTVSDNEEKKHVTEKITAALKQPITE